MNKGGREGRSNNWEKIKLQVDKFIRSVKRKEQRKFNTKKRKSGKREREAQLKKNKKNLTIFFSHLVIKKNINGEKLNKKTIKGNKSAKKKINNVGNLVTT